MAVSRLDHDWRWVRRGLWDYYNNETRAYVQRRGKRYHWAISSDYHPDWLGSGIKPTLKGAQDAAVDKIYEKMHAHG
jgi:hypothetical protein